MRSSADPAGVPRSRRRRAAAVGWSLLIAATAAVQPADAQWVKLSDGLSFSDVETFTLSPDGERVVYVHDAAVDGADELYGVAAAGGSPVLLSAVLPSGSWVGGTVFTGDGARVVYDANQDSLTTRELYSVPPQGGAWVKLNEALDADDNVTRYQVCPDADQVVYAADPGGGWGHLFSAPAAGGWVIPLNPDVVYSDSFEVSSDCARVLYLQGSTGPLFSMSIAGGTPTALSPAGTRVAGFHGSPNGQWVVYWTEPGTGTVFYELYSVATTGGTPVRLNGDLVSGGTVSGFLISPDSTRVVYTARQDTVDVNELYSVPIAGGTVLKLNGLLVSGGDVINFAISPDSTRVVYKADEQTDGVEELYSVPIGDGTVVKLNGALVAGGDVLDFAVSPDSQWVVYRADELLDGVPSGFRVPLAGPAAAHALIWSRPVVLYEMSYHISGDSRYVIVNGNGILTDGVKRLWQVNLAPTPQPLATELIPLSAFAADGDVTKFDVAANGNIVYIADQDTDEEYELYGIPLVFVDDFESGDSSAWWTP